MYTYCAPYVSDCIASVYFMTIFFSHLDWLKISVLNFNSEQFSKTELSSHKPKHKHQPVSYIYTKI